MIEKIGINFWGAAQCWNEKKVMHLIFELGTLRVNESDTQIRNDFNFTTNCYFNTILVSVCPQANEFILSLFFFAPGIKTCVCDASLYLQV